MTKLKDIAAVAGVSVDTVSRALNGKSKERWPRSARKAEEIREIARKMNYAPNRAAQMMRTRRTNQVGVLVSELYNPFTGRRLEATGAELSRRGYNLVLGLCPEVHEPTLEKFCHNLIDGIINHHPALDTADLQKFRPRLPIVTFNRSEESPAVFDMRQGVRQALDHLWSLGHRRIALVTGPDSVRNVSSRIAGYQAFYAGQSIAASPDWIVRTGWRLEDGEKAAAAFLAGDCTACVGGSALLSVGLIQGLRALGCEVPADRSLVSVEDTMMTQITHPPLTSVVQPIEELAAATVEHLVARIEERPLPPFRSFSSQLVVRASARAL